MGKNIDMQELGMNTLEVRCPICKESLDYSLEEVDMDCDIKSHSPNQFSIYVQCHNCDKDIEIVVNMSIETKRA